MRCLAVWLLSVSSPLERDLLQLDRPRNASLGDLDALLLRPTAPGMEQTQVPGQMQPLPSHPILPRNVSQLRPLNGSSIAVPTPQERRKQVQLFGNFMFKGIGVSVLKSLNCWQSCAFRFFIPITQNFPEYDRRVTLPRLVLHTAVFHPYEYRISLAVSVPLHIALYGLSRGLEGKLTTPALSRRIRRTRATASVKRVGVTFSIVFRMNSAKRVLFSMGPWVFFLPGPNFVERVLTLPEYLSRFLHVLQLYVHRWIERETAVSCNQTSNSFLLNSTRPGIYPNSKNVSKNLVFNHRVMTLLLRYVHSKSPGLGYNFGWTRTGPSGSFGTTAIFEMQYFYPLLKEIQHFRRLLTVQMASPE